MYDDKSYSDAKSNRIYGERKRWLWTVWNLAQQAYQSLTRLPQDRQDAITQEKYIEAELDSIRVAAYRAQENLKNEEI